MSQEKKTIIIVGGSLAGLLAGIPLKRLGHHVTILERTPTSLLHNQGAGIVFGDKAQSFFRKHIFPKIGRKELCVTSPIRQTLDKQGNVLHDERYAQRMISWDLVYFTLRANFDGLESEYCAVPASEHGDGEARYEVGRKVVAVRDLGIGKGLEVECELMMKDGDEARGERPEGEKETLRGDLIVAADGPSSTVRRIVCPEVQRSYAGYLIPGKAGSTESGARLINWVWYCNYPADSDVYKDLMTDCDGNQHHFTLPVGKIQPRLIEQQKRYATQFLSPQFAKLVENTKFPFVQAITDVLSPQASFMDARLLLVGDAVAGLRPHTAASTNQAAYHALLLEKVFEGEMKMEEAQEAIMHYARHMSDAGIRMGDRSQFRDSRERVGQGSSSNGPWKDTD